MNTLISFVVAVSLLAACENASQQKPAATTNAGAQSCQCTEGKQGQQGEVGKTGPQGKPGENSKDGLPGLNGLNGLNGEKGDKGDLGPQGPQGVTGLQGPMGAAGAQGLPGSDGTSCVVQSVPEGVLVVCGNEKVLVKHGDVGPQGIAGVQGPIGEKGADGLQGPVGPKGEMGPQGIKGDQGAQGLMGKDGAIGPKGDTGQPGKDGKDAAICPFGSDTVFLDGTPVYCHKLLVGTYTWQQCLKECGKFGLRIPHPDGLLISCVGDPNFFDWIPEGKYQHWMTSDGSSQCYVLMHNLYKKLTPMCAIANDPNYAYVDGNGVPTSAPNGFPFMGTADKCSNPNPCLCGKDLR